MGYCIPNDGSCAMVSGDAAAKDAACPAGTFGCTSGGQCAMPSILSCVTATNSAGEPTAYASVGTACTVDVDLDGNNDTGEKGFCASTGNGAETVCAPDCSAGSCAAKDAAGTNQFYCQHIEPVGTGNLTDLLDNGAADASSGHPAPNDRAICLAVADTCSQDADCASATSVGCDTDEKVCLPLSLNACAAGGVPGAASAGTACDSDGGGSDDGYCVPTEDTNGDSTPDSVTACF